jgi:hypothetical protein
VALLLRGKSEQAILAIDSFKTDICRVSDDGYGDVRFGAITVIKDAAKMYYSSAKRYLSEFMPPLIACVQDAPNIKVHLQIFVLFAISYKGLYRLSMSQRGRCITCCRAALMCQSLTHMHLRPRVPTRHLSKTMPVEYWPGSQKIVTTKEEIGGSDG